ncbi:MAG TPA: CoA-binding protein, partial [Pirellulaceae bacterium]
MSESVAVIGASQDPSKFSFRAIRAYQSQGFAVYPVNPKGGEILGLRVYRTLDDVPHELDRVSMYVPPAVGRGLLAQIARKGCREL